MQCPGLLGLLNGVSLTGVSLNDCCAGASPTHAPARLPAASHNCNRTHEMMLSAGLIHLCVKSLPTSAAVALHRCFSSVSKPPQRCESLAMLHGAVEAGRNLIPEPTGSQLATEAEMAELFPFTWNISQFRGRSIGERGLIVHYVPQVGSCCCLLGTGWVI